MLLLRLLAAMLVLGWLYHAPAAARADSATASVAIGAGGLTMSMTSTAPSASATVNGGADANVTYTITLDLIDARGSGAGWNLQITSTTFTFNDAPPPKRLATDASTITGVSVTPPSGSTSTLPTNSIAYPVTVPAANSSAPAAVKFYNAATSTGRGRFTVTPTVNIFVPGSTKDGTYTSTVTISVASGP